MKQLPTQKNESMKCLRSLTSSAVSGKPGLPAEGAAHQWVEPEEAQSPGPDRQTVNNIIAYARALDVLRPTGLGPVFCLGN